VERNFSSSADRVEIGKQVPVKLQPEIEQACLKVGIDLLAD
jgi:hypothetical protein